MESTHLAPPSPLFPTPVAIADDATTAPVNAESEPTRPRRPLSTSLKAMRIGHRNCLYSSRCGCAGGGARCHHMGRVVSLNDCVDCLTSIGILKSE